MDANLPPNWREFFEALLAHGVQFVVVGALAVAVHAEPRYSEDLDVFAGASPTNAKRLRAALLTFGFGKATPSAKELAREGPVWMLGRKPLRIDILTKIDGVSWRDAWRQRVEADVDGLKLPVIGRTHLIVNKAAAARPKDLRDLDLLRAHESRPHKAKRRARSTKRS